MVKTLIANSSQLFAIDEQGSHKGNHDLSSCFSLSAFFSPERILNVVFEVADLFLMG